MIATRLFARIVRIAAGAAVACALLTTIEAQTSRLFSRATEGESPAWLSDQLTSEVRGRMARFDAHLLEQIASSFAASERRPTFVLDAFDDAPFTVEVQQVEPHGAGRFVLHGNALGHGRAAGGKVLISVADGAIHGELTTFDGRKFAIYHAGGNVCRISEIDPTAAAFDCASEPAAAATRQQERQALAASADESSGNAVQASGSSETAAAESEPPVVDIMIVYTPAFLHGAGSAAAVQARCQLAIASANSMFATSEIRARVRLVHTARVEYAESDDMSVDLRRLIDLTDGYMDDIAALREQYAADVVHLFGMIGTGRRGMATGYSSDYHAVVISGEASLFVHELGHNFGCQHDRAAAGTGGSSYGFGHIFAGDDGRSYGCVMSYTGNAGAIQLAQFSNPNISYRGTPTGIPKGRADSADNARLLDITAPILATHRNPDGSSTRVPIIATPPRAGFPVTSPGLITSRQTIRLSFAGASWPRPINVTDFQVTGDADAFLVEIYDPTTRQFITGSSFTVPTQGGIQLFVRFRPLTNQKAEANITFSIDDPAHRYSPPPIRLVGNAAAPLLKNISTRVRVGQGDDALIGGFIVGGSSPREIMVRAIGPSLVTRGIAQALPDPVMELYRGSELIASNDDWGDGFQRESIRWSGVPPTRDLESAVLMKLEPGSYTAVVRGVSNAAGVGLIEAYDMEADDHTQFLNISTRGQVQSGENVMIGGFILGGASPSRVLVRALGPSLASAGVPGALQNPTLDIHDSQGARIASNDNWRSDNEAGIAATGIAPQEDNEAAILLTLQPAAYTAIVRGVNDTSGVSLVELYKLAAE